MFNREGVRVADPTCFDFDPNFPGRWLSHRAFYEFELTWRADLNSARALSVHFDIRVFDFTITPDAAMSVDCTLVSVDTFVCSRRSKKCTKPSIGNHAIAGGCEQRRDVHMADDQSNSEDAISLHDGICGHTAYGQYHHPIVPFSLV